MRTMTDDDARPTTWLDLPDAPAIPGLRFRRARRDDPDYAAIAEVFGASNGADDIPYAPSGTNLREDFEDQPAFDPDVDFVIAEVDGVQVGNTGVDRVQRGATVVYEVWGHVIPAWRRQGIGGRAAANLARARARAVAEGATTRGPRSPARSPRRPRSATVASSPRPASRSCATSSTWPAT